MQETAADGALQIAMDLPCARCGYDLRGMPREGDCPECGAAIDWSWRRYHDGLNRRAGPSLRFSERWWIEKLGNATVWILAGVLLSLLHNFWNPFESRTAIYRILMICCAMSVNVFVGLGLFRLATPEPGTSRSRGNDLLCYVIRAGALFEILWPLLMWTMGFRLPVFSFRWLQLDIDAAIVGVTTVAAYLWVSRLFNRMDRPWVAQRTRELAWLLGAMCLLDRSFWMKRAVSVSFSNGVHNLIIPGRGPEPLVGWATGSADLPALWIRYGPFERAPVVLWAISTIVSWVGIALLLTLRHSLRKVVLESAESGKEPSHL